ncbi:unnamed protein product [Rangifer tarandus platyrhynchus]|uniref:Uncharacterized protein n=1 Tax=Rangifer tarandus platyrhynchus TaxID=3082113 RepID=A0ABN8YEC8_RANTA|nr:unnamed protein product [Rangifer tarandus platyrhynchus]
MSGVVETLGIAANLYGYPEVWSWGEESQFCEKTVDAYYRMPMRFEYPGGSRLLEPPYSGEKEGGIDLVYSPSLSSMSSARPHGNGLDGSSADRDSGEAPCHISAPGHRGPSPAGRAGGCSARRCGAGARASTGRALSMLSPCAPPPPLASPSRVSPSSGAERPAA